jgi:hypothetical protein
MTMRLLLVKKMYLWECGSRSLPSEGRYINQLELNPTPLCMGLAGYRRILQDLQHGRHSLMSVI